MTPNFETVANESEPSDVNISFLQQGILDALFYEEQLNAFTTLGGLRARLRTQSETCISLYQGTNPELIERAAKVAMQHIVFGNQEKARVMIEANPRILLCKSQAKDYSGRTIIATPFQAALGAEDERMWEMMMPYFEVLEELGKINSAVDEVKRQFEEQFPEGVENIPASELQAMYNGLAYAIVDNDDNGKEAIEAFRKTITQHNCIESGKHFNMQHLIAAYQAYVDNFYQLQTLTNRDTFWIKVIGFVQRQMPANYAQAHCSGIKNVLNNAGNFKRKLNLYFNQRFFPLSEDAIGLGFDFAVYSGSGLDTRPAVHAYLNSWGGMDGLRAPLKIYLKQKQNYLSRATASKLSPVSELTVRYHSVQQPYAAYVPV